MIGYTDDRHWEHSHLHSTNNLFLLSSLAGHEGGPLLGIINGYVWDGSLQYMGSGRLPSSWPQIPVSPVTGAWTQKSPRLQALCVCRYSLSFTDTCSIARKELESNVIRWRTDQGTGHDQRSMLSRKLHLTGIFYCCTPLFFHTFSSPDHLNFSLFTPLIPCLNI